VSSIEPGQRQTGWPCSSSSMAAFSLTQLALEQLLPGRRQFFTFQKLFQGV